MSGGSSLGEISVDDNAQEGRYEARLGGKVIGVIYYDVDPGLPGVVTLVHTEVDPAMEGKGVGSRLVAGALQDIRRRGLSLVALCPFVRAYLRRHPEQADVGAAG